VILRLADGAIVALAATLARLPAEQVGTDVGGEVGGRDVHVLLIAVEMAGHEPKVAPGLKQVEAAVDAAGGAQGVAENKTAAVNVELCVGEEAVAAAAAVVVAPNYPEKTSEIRQRLVKDKR
jgi:hypothetical protein